MYVVSPVFNDAWGRRAPQLQTCCCQGDLPPGFHIKPSQSRPGQVWTPALFPVESSVRQQCPSARTNS
eukprot:6468557-Amphidinium_carterae.1